MCSFAKPLFAQLRPAILAIAIAAVVRAGSMFGQEGVQPKAKSEPLSAPHDVSITLKAKENRTVYRRGELIHLELAYSAEANGRYLKLTPAAGLLDGGREAKFGCTSKSDAVPLNQNSHEVSASRYLWAGPNCGGGIGSGFSEGCECGGDEFPLGPDPISYPYVLNRVVQIGNPGRYTCTVTAADVATAHPARERRAAFRLASNPVALEIVDDPVWSRAALEAVLAVIEASCSTTDDDMQKRGSWQRCADAASQLRFLDTEDSLRAAIRLYHADLNLHWQAELWQGVLQTAHRKPALEALESRMQDEDFSVTPYFLDVLTAWALRENHPEAFDAGSEPAAYHEEALELMGKYARMLGASLPRKRGEALLKSAQTYAHGAEQTYCGTNTLVPGREAAAVMEAAEWR